LTRPRAEPARCLFLRRSGRLLVQDISINVQTAISHRPRSRRLPEPLHLRLWVNLLTPRLRPILSPKALRNFLRIKISSKASYCIGFSYVSGWRFLRVATLAFDVVYHLAVMYTCICPFDEHGRMFAIDVISCKYIVYPSVELLTKESPKRQFKSPKVLIYSQEHSHEAGISVWNIRRLVRGLCNAGRGACRSLFRASKNGCVNVSSEQRCRIGSSHRKSKIYV